MKTTLYLEDNLYRRAKIKALEQGRTVSELVAEGLHLALNGILPTSQPLQRVPLPRIESASPPLRQLTPHEGARILLSQETNWTPGLE